MTRLGIIIAFCALILDQVSKWWIINIIELPKIQMVQILPIFNLQWAENKGVSFSLLASDSDIGRWALVVLGLVIVVGCGYWLKSVQHKLLAISLGLIIGGGLGNVIDRAVYGYVADFLQFYVGDWSFAIFNVADSCISVGAALFIWDMFFGPQAKKDSSAD